MNAHLIVGGFPAGASAGHDMTYAKTRLLDLLEEQGIESHTSEDFGGLGAALEPCSLLVTYVAGPYPAGKDNEALAAWLRSGGRWLGLHGTSGGRAARLEDGRRGRRMVKTEHHSTLGSFFLNHPPVRRFSIDVDLSHPLTAGLPDSFEVADELYFIELQDPAACRIFLTTQLPTNPAPGFGFAVDEDTSLLPDGRTRALAYTMDVGDGGVTYIALGHCHDEASNGQPFVDVSVDPNGTTPPVFRGSWETEAFQQLLRNAISWGCQAT